MLSVAAAGGAAAGAALHCAAGGAQLLASPLQLAGPPDHSAGLQSHDHRAGRPQSALCVQVRASCTARPTRQQLISHQVQSICLLKFHFVM